MQDALPFRQKEDRSMELEKIRNLSDEELIAMEKSAAEQLRVLKLDIARSKTVAREREIAADKAVHPLAKNVAPAKSTRTERKAKGA